MIDNQDEQPRKGPQARTMILAAAVEVFSRDGFSGSSIPYIAKLAGVTPPLVYYHYGSKDALWREAVAFSMSKILNETAAIRNATKTLSPLDRLRSLLYAFTDFAARSTDHVVMVLSEAGSKSDRFEWAQSNFSNVLLMENLAILEDVKKHFKIEGDYANKCLAIILGGILINFTIQPKLPEGGDRQGSVAEYAEMMFHLFARGIGIDMELYSQ